MEFSQIGDPIMPGQEPPLAPGVVGTAFDTETGIYIPFIAAKKPGSGDVSRFLDALPKDRRIVFTGVISGRLYEMLERRGFTSSFEEGEEIMVRLSTEASAG